ncbi:hypothetical protein QAD02_015218 [Eretmocerus hayati]|uniref:Uncharacterized protein n=1 Tax=Eretmocerus hayati TaxID=131215 RepID=A0ACC2P7L3_9HYME|nr:hypothetical protein QAD02_015218 [Eretmocerus hayati]
MHGRVKVRTSAEQERIREAEKRKKALAFKKGVELIFEKRKNGDLDDEILVMTEKLLAQLPDVYTLWNIRREALLNNNWSDDERVEKLEKELPLTETCLRENPKSYCAWHHRQWVIEYLPYPNWQRELNLCNKCLNLDDRNFHCWNYRRFVVLKACVSDEEELDFTTNKIMNNFSNYSSWHYRSKLLPKLYPSDAHDLPIRSDKYNEELDIVMNATFTDPNDTSAWFYQRWLLNYWEPSSTLWQAMCFDTKVIAVFYKEVPADLKLFVDSEEINCQWISVTGKKFSTVWYTEISGNPIDTSRKVSLMFLSVSYELIPCNIQNVRIYKSNVQTTNCNSSQLKEQLESYRTLVELEPDNKWARLTSLHLMSLLDFQHNFADILKELERLVEMDPLRVNYYKDMRSKYIIRHRLNSDNDPNESHEIDLCGLGLTTLADQGHYLTFYRDINISNNNLGEKLHQIKTLHECKKLDLANNHITSLKEFPILPNLEILLLSSNQISEYREILIIVKNHNLRKLDLRENPIADRESLISDMKKLYAQVEVII